jgi:hypothetical protein
VVQRLDLIRKEEIPPGVVHFSWDAKMLRSGDDPIGKG